MGDYYPAFLNLRGRRCVVIGGGEVAARKGRQLLGCGAAVTFVSPDASEEVRELAAADTVQWVARSYQPGDLAGAFLAIAATNDARVNREVSREATEGHVLLNVADVPALCDFIAPSVAERGPVTVAFSTGGSTPALARKLRESLERWPMLAWADAADVLAQVRRELRAQGIRVPPDAWQEAMDDAVLALVQAGRDEEAKQRLLGALTEAARVPTR